MGEGGGFYQIQREGERKREREREREREETDRQTDRQTGRQTDRQTDRQTSYTSDRTIGSPAATLPGTWRYKISSGTEVSIL